MDQLIAALGGVGSLSASALVAVAVLAIFRGWLVPVRYYNELKTERDRLRTAVTAYQTTVAEKDKQITRLTETLGATDYALRSVPKALEGTP